MPVPIYPFTNLDPPIPTDVHTDLTNFTFNLDASRAAWGNHGGVAGDRIAIVDNSLGTAGPVPIVSDQALPTSEGNVLNFGYGHDGNIYGFTDAGKIVDLGTDGSSVTLLAAAPGGVHISSAYVLKNATATYVVMKPSLSYHDWNYYDVVNNAWRTLDTTTLTSPAFYGADGTWINQWCLDIDGDLWGFGSKANTHVGDLANYFAAVKFNAAAGTVAGHWQVPAAGFNLSTVDTAFHRQGDATDHFVIGWGSAHTYAVSRSDPTTVNIATTNRSGFEPTILNLEPNSAAYWIDGDQFIGAPQIYSADTLALIETVDPDNWADGATDLGGGGAKYDWRNNAWVTMGQSLPSYITWHFFRFKRRSVQSFVRIGLPDASRPY